MKTYQISEFRVDNFESKMKRFSNRATKLGIDFGYNLESESFETVKVDNEYFTYKAYNYTVWGESPEINGYTFLAKIEPIESTNLIHSHNTEYNFSAYRTAELTCQHCNVNRYRIFYYLIKSESGNVKMVGRNCLANYMGLPDAEQIATFYESFIIESNEFESEDDYMGGNGQHSKWINLIDFLTIAKIVISESGYASQKSVEERINSISTKNVVQNEFYNTNSDRIRLTESDKKETKTIIESVKSHLREKLESSEYNLLTNYEHTILSLIESEYMTIQHAGYIVSIIPFYNRINEIKFENSERAESNWIGSEGQKVENIEATLSYQNEIESQYGITYLYKFVDNIGNVLTWFSSRNMFIENGDNLTILKATVKKHDIYNNVKQTIITRAKLSE